MFVWRPCLTLRFDPHDEMQVVTFVLYVGKAGVEGGVSDTIQSRYQGEYSKYIARDASSLFGGEGSRDTRRATRKYLTLRPLEYWFFAG